jgi:hypothetical protein
MSRKVFTAGEVLAAADVNNFLMDQTVMSFAGTASRGSAIGTATEGMTTYLEDSDRYESWSGAAWRQVVSTGAWVSYTPTLTNITTGNGTLVGKYNVVGRTMFLHFKFTLGSTSSIGSIPRFQLPAGFTLASANFTPVGAGFATISSVNYVLTVVSSSSDRITCIVNRADSTYTIASDITATVPATWATGSILEMNATVEIG